MTEGIEMSYPTSPEPGELIANLKLDVGTANSIHRGEDRLLALKETGLFAVFDGMGGFGGEKSGAKAASKAAEVIEKFYESDIYQPQGNSIAREITQLAMLMERANSKVQPPLVGKRGTTASVLRLSPSTDGQIGAVWANVGDSRIYWYRDGQLEQLSKDESQKQKDENGREVIVMNNYLGDPTYRLEKNKNTGDLVVQPGDRFLLCSDGLTEGFSSDEQCHEVLAEALTWDNPQAAAVRLLTAHQYRDDKSIIVVHVY